MIGSEKVPFFQDERVQAALQRNGLDNSLTGRFARFREREIITIITFREYVDQTQSFQINDVNAQGEVMGQVRDFVNGLQANGGTAIYTALAEHSMGQLIH